MPFLTDDEFFGENLINNLASFFDIDPSRITVRTLAPAVTSLCIKCDCSWLLDVFINGRFQM